MDACKSLYMHVNPPKGNLINAPNYYCEIYPFNTSHTCINNNSFFNNSQVNHNNYLATMFSFFRAGAPRLKQIAQKAQGRIYLYKFFNFNLHNVKQHFFVNWPTYHIIKPSPTRPFLESYFTQPLSILLLLSKVRVRTNF